MSLKQILYITQNTYVEDIQQNLQIEFGTDTVHNTQNMSVVDILQNDNDEFVADIVHPIRNIFVADILKTFIVSLCQILYITHRISLSQKF